MYCHNCGAYAPDDAKFCSNCGTKLVQNTTNTSHYTYPPNQQSLPAYSGKAIAGFVVSLAGLLLFPLVCGIVGLILSYKAFDDIQVRGARGNGFATAGIVISIIDILYSILAMILAASILSAVFSAF